MSAAGRRWPLRWRLAATVAGLFAALLAAGATVLYLRLERALRADADRGLTDTARGAQALFAHDLAEYGGDVRAAAAHIVTELVFGDRRIVAMDGEGRAFATSQGFGEGPALEAVQRGLPLNTPVTAALPGGAMRVIHVHLAGDVGLVIGIPLAPLEARLGRLRLALTLGLPAIIALGAAGGVAGARVALRPVERVAADADRVALALRRGDDVTTPVPVPSGDDEVSRVAGAVEGLRAALEAALARERAAVARQRRFLQDAAHELRTPVAIVRTQAESALAHARDPAHDRAVLQAIADEAARLGRLVGDLMLLAREGDGAVPAALEVVYLDDLASSALARVRRLPIAAGRELRLGAFEEVPVRADPALLERAILALLDNALRHAPGSAIEVTCERRLGPAAGSLADPGAVAELTVRDWGPGIAPDAEARAFERFGRLDPSVPGTGLGLPIARHIAEALGGRLSLRRPDGGGVAFVLEVPVAG